MSEPSSQRSWSVPLAVADIAKDGAHVELAASEPVRDAVAREAGLVALPRLELAADVRRRGADGVAVKGTLSATVVQTCVVTLDPVTAELEEPIELVFSSRATSDRPADAGGAESPDAADPPEPLVGDSIDLGAIAVEALILGLDPYPRKPDAVFVPPEAEAKDDGPFAALAALREGTKEKG